MSQLEDLLQQCTVKIIVPGGWGTGFFVATGLILTCAHVVQAAQGQSVQVCWQTQELEAIVARLLPTYDLALLRLASTGLSNVLCVYFGEEFSARACFKTFWHHGNSADVLSVFHAASTTKAAPSG